MYEQYWTAWGYIMQSRTILVLRLIPDKGRSKALPLFIAMRGISNNFLVHLPSWHDELRVCKEKQIKLLLMFQNVLRLEKTSNSESVSLPVWRLEIFCWGDMKKNLIKGRSLESVWSLLNLVATGAYCFTNTSFFCYLQCNHALDLVSTHHNNSPSPPKVYLIFTPWCCILSKAYFSRVQNVSSVIMDIAFDLVSTHSARITFCKNLYIKVFQSSVKEWVSFFLGLWGMNQSAGQTNRVNRKAVLRRFVCSALRFIPHEPRK